jgi:4-amino-4-deoxy-L-arabinose transferase-like glycosyltransferase
MLLQTEVLVPIRADALDYYLYALNLKECGTYSRSRAIIEAGCSQAPAPDAQRTPGYPLFLLPFVYYPIDQSMLDRILWTQALIGVLTIWISFLLFKAFLPWMGATVGAGLVALSPHLVAAGVYVLTETLFTFALVLFAWCTSRLIRYPSRAWALATGLTLATTALIRPTIVYFIAPFLGFLVLMFPRPRMQTVLMVLTGFLLLYGPWMARNEISLEGRGSGSLAMDTVHKGMYPGLMYRDDPATYGYPNRSDPNWSQRKHMAAVLSEIADRFRAEPGRYLHWYLIGKPLTFLSWDMIVGMGDVFVYPVTASGYDTDPVLIATHKAMYLLHWPIVLLALLGGVLVWLPSVRQRLAPQDLIVAQLLSLVLGYFLAVHIVGTPLPRYSVPLRPVLFGLAVLVPVLLFRAFGRTRDRA